MKTYSNFIKGCFKTWITVIELQPDNEYSPEYPKWKRRDKLAGNKFEAAYKAEGLNYLEVYKDLLGNEPMIINR